MCVHMQFWKIPWAWYFTMSIRHCQQKLKETMMIWQLSENNFQVWSPRLHHFLLCFSRVTRSPDVSLCYNTLDMELLREETKEPVNLQEFFSPG